MTTEPLRLIRSAITRVLIKVNPKNASAYSNRGVALRDKGDFNGTLDNYAIALSLHPKDAYTYNNRGAIHADRNDYNAAIADFSQAIALNSNDAEAYFNRSVVEERGGDLKQRTGAQQNRLVD